jgi:uncharacterized membrane protein
MKLLVTISMASFACYTALPALSLMVSGFFKEVLVLVRGFSG